MTGPKAGKPKKAAAKKKPKKAELLETPTHSRDAVSRAIAEAAAAAPSRKKAPPSHPTTNMSPSPLGEAVGGEVESAPKKKPSSHETPPPDAAQVADRIRELEQRLDKMIDQSARTDRERVPPPPPSSRALPVDGEPTVFDTARELLSTDFYLRKWGRLGMRNRSEEVDDFGFDPVYEKKAQPLFDFLYDKYFRVTVEGMDHIPAEGRCLLVANHSGTLPYDGVMI